MSIYPIQQQYQNAAPPFVPNIQVLPQYTQLVIPTCSLIANLAVKSAQISPVRQWMLEVLSQNNWQNQDYATAVKFAIDYHMHRSTSQGGNSFEGDVEIALTLYTSFVACNTVGMLDNVEYYQRAHLQSNAALYGNVVKEIRSIYQNQNPYQAQASYQRPGSGHPQQSRNTFGQAHVNPVASQLYGGRRAAESVSVPRQGSVRASSESMPIAKAVPKINRVNNYGAVIINPIEKMEMIDQGPVAEPPPEVVAAAVETEGVFDPIEPVEPGESIETNVQLDWEHITGQKHDINSLDVYNMEDDTLDRELHSLPYYGERPEAIKPVTRDVFEAVVMNEETEAAKEEIVANDVWFVEATLSELLNVARVKALATPASEMQIQHFHGFVVTPVIGRVNLKAYFEKVRPVVTFADFSLQTKEYFKVIAEKADSEREVKDTLVAIAGIDRLLTNMVNHFLLKVLPELTFTIDSVVQDGVEITKSLNSSVCSIYMGAFMRYQRAVFETFFKHTSLEGDSFSGVVEYEHGDGVFIDQVATSYAILYMDGTPAEFKLVERNRQIDITLHQLMYRLLEATGALEDKKVMATRQVLLFSDGTHYDVVKKTNGDYQLDRM